ncbi:MAG: UDP-N-acetylmuramoyl-L-alanyl-D-glutamate--2,6-diaminopimelate ligase [Melioribacteraceae bacterium]|nr:UDP-N-acetylmuramoyl-L-alanyl-D-glutamate--2,6-diaminopimelate ligase [Melioribacteraceae bacterium]
MFLSDILNSVNVLNVIGEAEKAEVKGITNSSLEVESNFIFVAVSGFKTDGHKYLQDAINRGASAVIIENSDACPDDLCKHHNVIKVLVNNSRIALAQLSHAFYNRPSEKLLTVGITGTKGKTTTSYFIKHILWQAEYKTGLIGTIANYIGNKKVSTKLTTPEAHNIAALMSEMNTEGCTHCVMEVSSHSLALHRTDGIKFNLAVFTNLTSDHFDFHKDFTSYRDAKKKLFDDLSVKSQSVINIDDKNWSNIILESNAHALFYGKSEAALYRLTNISYDINGTKFDIEFNETLYNFNTKLIGEFNAYNATAAIAVAHQLGMDWEQIQKGVSTMPQVPGRFEVISHDRKKVIIDYSHTTDSLKQALITINSLIKGSRKIYTVFGCGGDRDTAKRPEMGSVAEMYSDKIIVTSDNPRTEKPEAIIDDIVKGMNTNKYKIIADREKAIEDAIINSEEDAVILIAGKGHEDYQEIKGVRSHFSDKEKAEEYLAKCLN